MSFFLFNWIVSFETFIATLLGTIKKDYLNLEPKVKALLDGALSFGNVLKAYIANPGSAGPVGSEFITILEGILGTGIVSGITTVINEALIDIGIIGTALTDPAAAYQALLNHLATFTGAGFGKELFKVVSTIAIKVTQLEDNNEIMAIIAIAYKLFFQNAPVVVIPVVAAPVAVPVPGNPDLNKEEPTPNQEITT